MKIKSALLTTGSGSVGGLTLSHNSGGLYLRARRVPTNPSSSSQEDVRNAMAGLTAAWGNTLTESQREAWRTYAATTPITGKLGDQITLAGLNWYVACNVPRLQAGLSVVQAAPEVSGLATLTLPEVDSFDASAEEVDIAFDDGDAWANEVGGALLIYASRPQSAGVNFFKGPYRFAGAILGAASPPASPATIVLPFPIAVGQRVFFAARAVMADGRISSRVTFRGDVTGA